ncbi:MAG: hypothetical protein NVS2B8_04390 [Vulcanimicrobiaceae bacterium]
MDCYYHNAVPSVAVCTDCTQTICATCRDAEGICPGCRLERRMTAAGERPELRGARGPRPGPGPRRRVTATVRDASPPGAALATVSGETRALLGLGYPLWPLAALALLDPKRSGAVRRQATQALALNFGMFGLFAILGVVSHVWLLGLSAMILMPLLAPVWLVATVVYGFKVWQGQDVRVPLVSDWLDERDVRRDRDAAVA